MSSQVGFKERAKVGGALYQKGEWLLALWAVITLSGGYGEFYLAGIKIKCNWSALWRSGNKFESSSHQPRGKRGHAKGGAAGDKGKGVKAEAEWKTDNFHYLRDNNSKQQQQPLDAVAAGTTTKDSGSRGGSTTDLTTCSIISRNHMQIRSFWLDSRLGCYFLLTLFLFRFVFLWFLFFHFPLSAFCFPLCFVFLLR